MSGFLLDTCAISDGTRPKLDAGLAAWLKSVDPSQDYLSVVTLGELRKGIEVLEDRAKAARLEVWLETAIPAQFADRILPFDAAVADRWGRLIAAMKRRGTALSPIDSHRRHGLTP